MSKVKWLDAYCHVCGQQLNSWDARISKVLGYKHTTCEKCIAKEYGKDTEEFRGAMEEYFGMRPCLGL